MGVGDDGQPTLRWGAGGCVGDFHDPRQVNGKMEWGAETHCSGNGWTPHQLELILEQKKVVNNWFDSFHEVAWIGSKPNQMGSPNISIAEHWRTCDDFDDTDYRIIAKLTAGSHKKTTISDEYTVDCLYDSTI